MWGGPTRRIYLVACLAGALSSLDSAVNIAFPAITEAFRIDVSSLQWVVVSYVLTYAALLLPFGRLADRVGHRRVLISGLMLSAAALAACGAATTFTVFLVARIAQGVGIALVLAPVPALVTLSVADEARARALGVLQMSIAAGFAAGPAIGGVLLEASSWRLVYLFRVPLALAILVLAAGARLSPASVPERDGQVGLDLPGAVTFALGLASALFVASRGTTLGWTSPATLGLLLLAVALFAGFVVAERRAPLPLVDLSLFRTPAFLVANLVNGLANAAMFSVWLLGPTLLLTVRGHGTIPGGLLLGVTAMGTAVASPLAGRLTSRFGVGGLSMLGLACEAVGLAAVSRLSEATATIVIVLAFALVGAGLGLFQVPNMSYVMGSIPRASQGVAGGMTQMVRTAGVVGGVAAANVLFVARRRVHADGLGVTDLTSTDVFVPSFRDVLVASALLCVAAAALSLVRPDRLQP